MEQAKTNNRTSPLRWVWRVSAGTRWEVLWLLVLNVLSGGSGVALAWALRNMIDRAVAQSREPEAQRRAVEHLRGIESRNAAAAKRLLEI